MYTAINWAMDLGFYAGFSALTCTLWWILGRRADRKWLQARTHVMRAATDAASASGQDHSHLTVSKALPLIYRRSRDTGALLEREENPDTPRTAEIPVVSATASSMWRLPRALPLAWILYLAGLLIFVLLPIPSDPQAACAMARPCAVPCMHSQSCSILPCSCRSALLLRWPGGFAAPARPPRACPTTAGA